MFKDMDMEEILMVIVIVVLLLMICRNSSFLSLNEGFGHDDDEASNSNSNSNSQPSILDSISNQVGQVSREIGNLIPTGGPSPANSMEPSPNAPAPNAPAPNAPAPNAPAPNAPVPNAPAPNAPAPNAMAPSPNAPVASNAMAPSPNVPVAPTPNAPVPVPNSPPSQPPAQPSPVRPDAPNQDQLPPLLRDNGTTDGIRPYDVDGSGHAPADVNYGENIPLSMQQEYLTLKSMGKLSPQIMKNLEEKRGQASVSDSQVKAFSPDAHGGLLPSQMGAPDGGIVHTHPHYHGQGQQQPGQPSPTPSQPTPSQPTPPQPTPPQQPAGGDDKQLEIHMVYGAWCGHSKRAIPAFEDLMKESGVQTTAGTPISFMMTEDKDPGFEIFKKQVRGFPTYMVVGKQNGEIVGMQELKVQNRQKETILEASKALPL
jgi:thiol-disulfide isomerase/thioredoxin